MKRVSFEVAKCLKEAGYPQDKSECNEGYAISEVRYQVYSSRDGRWYAESADPGSTLAFDLDYYYPEDCGEYCVAPYYLDAWLWLWREKGIHLNTDTQRKGIVCIYWDSTIIHEIKDMGITDPEYALEVAITYLVNNDLIK